MSVPGVTQETRRNYDYHHTVLTRIEDSAADRAGWMEQFLIYSPVPAAFYRGKTGLDLGCGGGRFSHCAALLGAQICGMDLSRGVDSARVRCADMPNACFVQGDINQPPFRDGAFDFVFSFGVVHHLPGIPAAFREATRLLKPGGSLLLWVYAIDGMNAWYRLSHLRFFRRLLKSSPLSVKVAASGAIAASIDLFLVLPLRLFRRQLPLQLATYAKNGWRGRVASVFDRLGVPSTEYMTKPQLMKLVEQYGLADPVITMPEQWGGWCCWAKKPGGGGEARGPYPLTAASVVPV